MASPSRAQTVGGSVIAAALLSTGGGWQVLEWYNAVNLDRHHFTERLCRSGTLVDEIICKGMKPDRARVTLTLDHGAADAARAARAARAGAPATEVP